MISKTKGRDFRLCLFVYVLYIQSDCIIDFVHLIECKNMRTLVYT